MRKYAVWLVIAVGLLVGGVVWLALQEPAARDVSAETIEASGIVQVHDVTVASELGGRVAQVLVEEGGVVRTGQPVVCLDTALINAQIAIARAAVEAAEAGLRQARAGARPTQIAVAQAQLRQAEAGLLAAQQAVTDTQALVETPQDVILQIAVMRKQLDAAQHRLAEAAAQKDALEITKGAFDDAYARFDGGGRRRFLVRSGTVSDLLEHLPSEIRDQLPPDWADHLPTTGDHTAAYGDYELHLVDGAYELYVWKTIAFPLEAHLLPNLWWKSWVGVNSASAQVDALEAQLNHLYTVRAEPQDLVTGLHQAMAAQAELEAQVKMAEAQLEALQTGLTAEELAVVEAKVQQAHAGLEAMLRQREMLTVTAPISGTVTEVLITPGEVAARGAPLLTLADLTKLMITVYVSEPDVVHVKLGQPVEIRVDSFPDQIFMGSVEHIADEAEFTPRNVSTKEERQNLVFAVDVRVDNPEGSLKPGMPADVRFLNGDLGQ